MSYDVAFRYQQALDPSALSTILTALHGLTAAVTDCRNAGLDPECDPAVILLGRHLAGVCIARGEGAALRQACMARIGEGAHIALTRPSTSRQHHAHQPQSTMARAPRALGERL
jgi:hypothetical protein